MQTIIDYDLPIKIDLGDVFYSIEEVGKQHYYEPCKVCEGKSKLTVNDVTFDCPCCKEYRSPFSICRFKVTRWRVYEIAQEISAGYWKKGDTKNLIIKLYTTTNRGYGNNRTKILNEFNFKNNRNAEFEEIQAAVDSYYRVLDHYIFNCYSIACQVADKLNAFEEQKVEQHNKEFGTNYALPDKPKYDPKSN